MGLLADGYWCNKHRATCFLECFGNAIRGWLVTKLAAKLLAVARANIFSYLVKLACGAHFGSSFVVDA